VLAHPQILGEDVLVVTSEFGRWVGIDRGVERDRLDVLGLDSSGRLVVAELKRGTAPDTVGMQALKYAGLARGFTSDRLASAHAQFLTRRGTPTTPEDAAILLEEHAGPLDPEQLRRPEIVIVAEEYGKVLTSTVLYLIEQGLPMRLLRVRAWDVRGQVVITVSQELPLPDADEFLLTPDAAQRRDRQEARTGARRERTSVERILTHELIEPGATLTYRLYSGRTPEAVTQVDRWISDNPARGRAVWNPDLDRPLEWELDGVGYTPSSLARLIYREATGEDRGANGPRSWLLDDERDLFQLAGGYGTKTEFRSVDEIMAEAEASGAREVLKPFLNLAEEFGLPRRGYKHGIMITAPDNRSRYVVWLAPRAKGTARVTFNHEQLARLTRRDRDELEDSLPTGIYDAPTAGATAANLRALLAATSTTP
jgi:hypothetical protein